MMACAVTDFPDPDSPTMASVEPADSLNETSLTASMSPDWV
jgi:hypothetical protein